MRSTSKTVYSSAKYAWQRLPAKLRSRSTLIWWEQWIRLARYRAQDVQPSKAGLRIQVAHCDPGNTGKNDKMPEPISRSTE